MAEVGVTTSADILRREAAGTSASASAAFAKASTHGMGEVGKWTGVGFGALVMALLSVIDYEHEKKLLRERYENEIGARVGKAPEKVTNKDLEKVAGENKAIGDALRRLRWRRNLSVGITTISMVGAFALSQMATASITFPGTIASVMVLGTPLATFALGAIVSFSVCVLAEKVLTKVGEKSLRVDEPEIRQVERNPELQKDLSVAGQIHYLARLQARNVKIEPEQLSSVFLKANPKLATLVEKRFGVPFDKLPPSARANAINSVAPNNKIQEYTDDLNNHLVRAQELAFAVEGKTSGVPKLETPQALVREREQSALEQKLEATQQKIDALHAKLHEQASRLASTAGQKLGFKKSDVAMGTQATATEPTLMQAPQQTAGSFASRILAERQEQNMKPLTVGA